MHISQFSPQNHPFRVLSSFKRDQWHSRTELLSKDPLRGLHHLLSQHARPYLALGDQETPQFNTLAPEWSGQAWCPNMSTLALLSVEQLCKPRTELCSPILSSWPAVCVTPVFNTYAGTHTWNIWMSLGKAAVCSVWAHHGDKARKWLNPLYLEKESKTVWPNILEPPIRAPFLQYKRSSYEQFWY